MLTSMRFAKELDIFKEEVPFELFGYPDGTSNRITNCQYMTVDGINVEDVRASPVELGLDTTGFTYLRHKSACDLAGRHFERAGSVVTDNPLVLAYLEESIDLVKRELGADKVICFDWRFRRTGAPPSVAPLADNTYDIRLQALAPGLDIHCDFSHRGGGERLEMHLLPEELEAVKNDRWDVKIVNVWRPLAVVRNAPLVITDRRTVLQEDLMEVEKVLPDKVERNYYVKYRPYHQYYYMSDQGPEDVAMFVTWDKTKGDKTAETPPHGAASFFADDCIENPRESIEVRLIVLSATHASVEG